MRTGRPPVDITGQRFGRLVAIKMIGTKKGHAQWLCKCDCGNEHISTINCLKRGNVSSCGCKVDDIKRKREDSILGKRFGRLVVVKKSDTKNNYSYWECKCDCGKMCIVSRNSLKSGYTRSCGCLADEFRENCEIKNRKYNTFEIKDAVVYIDVNNPKFSEKKIVCDLDDWENELKKYYWNANDEGYACATKRNKILFMHKIVSKSDGKVITDHINQNSLDNRKENLRNTNHSMNAFNRKVSKESKSGYNGVWEDRQSGKWKVDICINGKHNHLGYFDKLEDAIEVRKAAELKYRGEFSRKD